MDLEAVFMSVFCIGKKPDNIFELIKAAITVGERKYPKEFKKHQNKILKQLMNSGVLSAKEDFENGYDSSIEEEEQMDAIKSFKKDEHSFFEDQENHEKENCNTEKTNSTVTTENQSFNKTNIETQGKNMNTTVTSMSKNCTGGSKKIKLPIKKHKQLDDGDQKGRKQSQINILQTTTIINLKSATKVDCIKVMRKSGKDFKETDSDADAQSKNTVLVKKKRSRVDFESSKRKYEDRLAEQNKAKRRTIMVDFHEMPKPANDPCAPKRCWNRRRF
ncbi:hypothetical protein A4A49_16419 [Nicotiana attenuata]|uniref:Uncharacterized protein n=1 Tax=Nicotiana attenuata TaxID=49451 RepID=A0A314KKU0_NICAT|nr:hypothetical protein A4A49_16419 [Nicotiana attenuata]